jgi:hypothetical protein
MDKRLILVAGSGRSGTSLFSGILKALGCHVPQPEVAADNTNPKGFGEPQWVVDFHTDLLGRAKVQTADARPSAWTETAQVAFDRKVEARLHEWLEKEFERGDHVVIKDPRILWFLPLWTTVGEHLNVGVRYATVLRHPTQVVGSKMTYYGELFNATNRTAGWINTMLLTERATREGIRTFTKYDDLLTDWTVDLARVADKLDLKVLDRIGTFRIRIASELVDPTLKRSDTDWDSLGVPKPIADLAEETWTLFDRLATKDDPSDPAVLSECDEMRQRYLEFYEMVEAAAQSSILAAKRKERENARGARVQPARRNEQARTFVARAKRKARPVLGRVKRRLISTRRK